MILCGGCLSQLPRGRQSDSNHIAEESALHYEVPEKRGSRLPVRGPTWVEEKYRNATWGVSPTQEDFVAGSVSFMPKRRR